jgi:hypothetical protein
MARKRIQGRVGRQERIHGRVSPRSGAWGRVDRGLRARQLVRPGREASDIGPGGRTAAGWPARHRPAGRRRSRPRGPVRPGPPAGTAEPRMTRAHPARDLRHCAIVSRAAIVRTSGLCGAAIWRSAISGGPAATGRRPLGPGRNGGRWLVRGRLGQCCRSPTGSSPFGGRRHDSSHYRKMVPKGPEPRTGPGGAAARGQLPAADRRASARSVRSQVKSSSSRPKWP